MYSWRRHLSNFSNQSALPNFYYWPMTFEQTNQTVFTLSAFKLSEIYHPLFSFRGIFSLSKSPLSTFKAFQLPESRTGKWKVEKHYPKSVVFIYRAPYVKFKRCLVRLLERQWSIMKLGWGSYQKAELESGKLESTTLKAWCLYIEHYIFTTLLG